MQAARDTPELSLKAAAELLKGGALVAIPTETVYGLAADATNPAAVVRIFEAKSRPRFNPLIVHCAGRQMAESLAEFPPLAVRLAERFWPGPLTLVLPTRPGAALADLVTAGLLTVALRVPRHEMALAVIAEVGRPLAAPSANPSGRLSPTSANAVREAFAGAVPVLDGGPCAEGIESTIVAVGEGAPVLLRPGAVPRDEIVAAAGTDLADPAGAAIAAPGMLATHYAPVTKLRLHARDVSPGEALLAFGPDAPTTEGPTRNLSPTGDLREAARNLFACLRELDATGAETIAVMEIPEEGLGEAINDRLRRAAAKAV